MAKVFIVQEPTKYDHSSGQFVPYVNLAPATEFGDLVFVLDPRHPVLDAALVMSILDDKLKDFKPEDFLLPIGDPAAICMAGAVACRYSDTITLLKWNKREKKYVQVPFNVK